MGMLLFEILAFCCAGIAHVLPEKSRDDQYLKQPDGFQRVEDIKPMQSIVTAVKDPEAAFYKDSSEAILTTSSQPVYYQQPYPVANPGQQMPQQYAGAPSGQ